MIVRRLTLSTAQSASPSDPNLNGLEKEYTIAKEEYGMMYFWPD
jgi:hypothetical protein